MKLAVAVLAVAVVLYFVVGSQVASVFGLVGLLGVGAYVFFSDPPSSSGPGSPGAINFGR